MRPHQILTVAVLAFGLAACGDSEASESSRSVDGPDAAGAKATEITYLTASESAAKLEADPQIKVLDIRTPGEYAQGHIKDAILIDFQSPDFKTQVEALDTDTTYIVHCKSGGRSKKSLPTFQELKFARIIHMDGGFDDWKAQNLPVEN